MKKTILLGVIFLGGIFLSYGQQKEYLKPTTLTKQLKLNTDEKDIMIDIIDLDADARELDSLKNYLSEKIIQLKNLKESAKSFSDLEKKISKKIKKLSKQKMSYACESEESKNMECYLLYDIYKQHLEKVQKKTTKN